jgi:hypothetical protein
MQTFLNKRNVLLLLFIILAARAAAQPARHVILISIDGLRPDMYLDSSWPTPNLRFLMKKGVYAMHLKSVFPAYTYPSHTAMVTGALPARYGVYFNQPKGGNGQWDWFSTSIRVPTIWKVLSANGRYQEQALGRNCKQIACRSIAAASYEKEFIATKKEIKCRLVKTALLSL